MCIKREPLWILGTINMALVYWIKYLWIWHCLPASWALSARGLVYWFAERVWSKHAVKLAQFLAVPASLTGMCWKAVTTAWELQCQQGSSVWFSRKWASRGQGRWHGICPNKSLYCWALCLSLNEWLIQWHVVKGISVLEYSDVSASMFCLPVL